MAILDDSSSSIVSVREAQSYTVSYLVAAFLLGYRESTRGCYSWGINLFLKFCADIGIDDPIHDVRRHHIELFGRLLEEKRGNKPATVGIRLATVRSFYNFLERDEHIEKNPGRWVRVPKFSNESPVAALSRNQFARLFDESRRRDSYHAMVCLMAFNGLRVSEVINANIENLAMIDAYQVLNFVGKGSKGATIPLSPPTWYAIMNARGDRTRGPIITTAGGARMSRSSAYKAIRRMGAKCGFPCHPHQLRHAAATAGLDANVSMRDMVDFMRHTKPETTMRYDRDRNRLMRNPTHIITGYLLS